MNFKLITAYPWWFFLLCILLGLLVTAILYFRKKESEYPKGILWILAFARFLSVTLLAFLLLSPMVRTIKRTSIKPSIVIGIDNSRSVILNADSAYYKGEFLEKIENLKSLLEKNFEVNLYSFGQEVKVNQQLDFTDQMTDLSELFNEVNTRYYNRNVGAVILASDGIYNSGSDPVYYARNARYPVFTINLGDTSLRKDIRIQKIDHNRTAFKGNRFPIHVTIQAVELSGERSKLSIYHDNVVLFSQDLNVSSLNQIISIPTLLEAKETGLMRLKVVVEQIKGEVNVSNNIREIFIEVLESKKKVALITSSPHPDVAALQRVIENSNNFEPHEFMPEEFVSKNPDDYSLVILNQLPALTNPYTQQIRKILDSKIPVLFIVGTQSNIQLLNSLDLGLTMVNHKGSYNEALPALNPSFSLFLYSDVQQKLIESVPPLISPFAGYNISNSVQVFTRQTIGSTITDMPQIMFNDKEDLRLGIISGEGIWKWRLFDFIQNNTHANFDELMSKVFQYLTAQADKSRFRIEWNNFYSENENIEFSGMLFNETGELITDPEVNLIITNEQNKKFDYTFSTNNDRYNLKVGSFSPGIYSFEAIANVPGEKLVKRGVFVVTEVKLEDINLTANHKLLNNIAFESGGKSYYPGNFEQLADEIKAREDVKTISYSRKNYIDLIDYYPLMILMFLMLGLEWFLRKYSGSY